MSQINIWQAKGTENEEVICLCCGGRLMTISELVWTTDGEAKKEIARLRNLMTQIVTCNYPPLDETQKTTFLFAQEALRGEKT